MHTLKKHLSIFYWLLAGLTLCGIGLYFRLYPLYHNVASDAYEKSTMIVIAQLRHMITNQVEQQNAHLSFDAKQSLIQKKLNETLRDHKDRVKKMFDDLGLKILQESPEAVFYLQESDSYYFLDLTENILKTGHVSSNINGNKFFHEKMTAPIGQWEPQLWHSYLGAFVYRLVKFFKPDTDVMFGVSWTPIILFPFVVLAFLFTAKSFGCSPFPATIAGIFFLLAHIFLKRSTFAWYDNDIYTILFPLISLGCLFQAFSHLVNIKKALFWGTLASISAVIYGQFWPGWIFLWILLSISVFILFIKNSFLKRNPDRSSLYLFLSIFIAPIFLLFLVCPPYQIFGIFTHGLSNLQKFIQPQINGWPDLYMLVGELKRSSLVDIIDFNGGCIIFFGAILSMFYGLWQICYKTTSYKSHLITLFIYLIGTLYLALGAQRFTMLTLVPLAVLFTFGLQTFWDQGKAFLQHYFSPKISLFFISFLLTLLSLFPLYTAKKNIRSYITTIFNSTWDKTLSKIRQETPENTIINTWWSPGHFIKAIAKRRVTFDGASIRGDIAFWLNRVYLSQTEHEALSTLRMLNTSSNEASIFLENKGWPLSKAVQLISGIILMERQQALSLIKKVLSEKDALHLLSLTHGEKGKLPPSQILLYNELMDSNVLFGYLGKWNFQRIEQLNASPSALKEIPKRSDKKFIDFIWSLVGGPYRQSSKLNVVEKKDSLVIFDQGVSINLETMNAFIDSKQFGKGTPLSVVYLDKQTNKVVEKKNPSASLSYCVVYFEEGKNQHVFLMDKEIATSLIVKLYYFNGIGLDHFKLFANESDLTGRTKILSFSVIWPENF